MDTWNIWRMQRGCGCNRKDIVGLQRGCRGYIKDTGGTEMKQ